MFPLKEKPQVPRIHPFQQRAAPTSGYDAQTPHYRALFDDKGRMMAIICHNTDLGDGWEREAEDPEYFRSSPSRKRTQWGSTSSFTP